MPSRAKARGPLPGRAFAPPGRPAPVQPAPDDTKPTIEDRVDIGAGACVLGNVTVDPARVRRPQDKGRVERTVAFVREDCFGGEANILSPPLPTWVRQTAVLI